MKLQNAFVCYLDLLGVKNKTGRGTLKELNAQVELLGSFMREIQRRQTGYARNISMGECNSYIKVFSDNIVLVMPLKIKDKVDSAHRFSILLKSIEEVLSEASFAGLLIRGGISYGKAICNDFMVAGDALIKAYNIESKISKYPRVVIDRSIGELIEEVPYKVAKDLDGELFFHYLYDASESYLGFNKRHVENCIKNTGQDIFKYIEKYRWLIDYHNACCKEKDSLLMIDPSIIGTIELQTKISTVGWAKLAQPNVYCDKQPPD
ncbi:hypothetical protein [Deefgea sp. CFH1-16]|uniref:hypothetical protein n=1 Tax=Deefgea sp. CFH1-16 TaxID=2675457 RepID=UPI0015F3F9B4|nr:hypothetical protein [Deefgea sp. CFH1-16]MBM5574438.1 hypothetical protein [Deefgea sp. CFH1-16]